MKRLFVALELPPSIIEALGALCEGVPGARWSNDDQFHLTLRFIGEVDRVAFEDIAHELGAIEADALELELAGVGHYPPRGAPRVLWAGIRPNKALLALQARIESAVTRAGQPPEGRKFSPHITLARMRNAPLDRVSAFLMRHGLFATEAFEVDAFHLYSSRMTPSGSHYEIEASFPLRGGYAFEDLWTEADEAAFAARQARNRHSGR